MIEKLSKEQEGLLIKVRDEWVDYFIDSEFDEQKVKKLYNWLYEINGLEKPEVIILDSPLACQMFYNKNVIDSGNKELANDFVFRACHVFHNKGKMVFSNRVAANAPDSMLFGLSSQIDHQVSNNVRDNVFRNLAEYALNRIDNELNKRIKDNLINKMRELGLSFFDYGYSAEVFNLTWLPFYDFFDRIGVLKNELFAETREYRKCSVFSSMRFENFVVVIRPPVFIGLNEKGRLHSKNDYAIYFKDGYGIHYVEGVYFEPELFERAFKKRGITSEEILQLRNTEQKAVLIKHFGYEFILSKLKHARVIDRVNRKWNNTDKEVSYNLIEFNIHDNPELRYGIIRVVKVEWWEGNNKRTTIVGVPREESTKTCKGAIAWTFGMNKEGYELIVES